MIFLAKVMAYDTVLPFRPLSARIMEGDLRRVAGGDGPGLTASGDGAVSLRSEQRRDQNNSETIPIVVGAVTVCGRFVRKTSRVTRDTALGC